MTENPIIMNVVDQILDICNPHMIILFNKKYDLFDNLTSFKLCVIVPDDVDANELECNLYLELDCENPFDVLIYRNSDWNNLREDEASFASTISKTGVVLYEL